MHSTFAIFVAILLFTVVRYLAGNFWLSLLELDPTKKPTVFIKTALLFASTGVLLLADLYWLAWIISQVVNR